MSSHPAGAVKHSPPEAHALLRRLPARVIALLRETADCWIADNAPRLSASLAFYSVLSLIPFLIVVASVGGHAFGEKVAQGQLMWEIQSVVGREGAQAIQGLMQGNHQSTTVTVLGLLTLAFGTSGVVMDLRDALNTIWHVRTDDTFSGFHGLLHMLRDRFYLFGLIVSAGLLIVASLALNALAAGIASEFGPFLPFTPAVLHTLVFLVSFLVVTVLFAAIYKLVPDVTLRWDDVIVGACVTSLFFTIGKQFIGMYLGTAGFGSRYGAAGSFLIVLVWVYYSAQLFFFGAEFTRVYARRFHPRKAIQ